MASNTNTADVAFENCPAFLERYLAYLSTFSNNSPATVMETCRTLREFCQYIHYRVKIREKPPTSDAHKDMDVSCMNLSELADVTQETVEEYFGFLDIIVRNSTATMKKKLVLLRGFYSYLERNADELGIRLADGNPTRYISILNPPTQAPKALSAMQIQRLLDGCLGDAADRDRAIILLVSTTALKLAEVTALDIEDLGDEFLTARKAGGAGRTVFLTAECKRAIRIYLTSGGYESGPLFRGIDTNKRLTPRAIQLRISKAAEVAGMSNLGINAEKLRDTAISTLLQGKRADEQAAILYHLGYRNAKSGQRFDVAPVSGNYIKDMIRNSPLNNLGSG